MMNANWFYALTTNGRSLAENAKEAGTVTLLGMVAIFAVLSLLWLVIEILHRALSCKKKTVQKAVPAAPVAEKSAPTAPAPVATESVDDGALIAAITAAVSAAMADDGYTGGFRVVSFKRAAVRKNGRI